MRAALSPIDSQEVWKSRLRTAEMHREYARAILANSYHPWQRFKRTFAIVAYFNLLFPVTFFGVLANYTEGSAVSLEKYVGLVGLAFMPAVNTVVIPMVIAFLEMGLHKLFQIKFMPEPNAEDTIPFLIALPLLEKPTHAIIGDVLSLKRSEIKVLLTLGTLLQMIQAANHTHESNATNFLDVLFHDPLFAFLGQYFIFGKLIPNLYSRLSEVAFKNVNARLQEFSKKVDHSAIKLFDCARPEEQKVSSVVVTHLGMHP